MMTTLEVGSRVATQMPVGVVQEAYELLLIDLPPRELLERLREGKVYVPEQARAAIDAFFSQTNLNALRELAMQTAAVYVDLVHTVFVAVERQHAGIAQETDAFDSVEHQTVAAAVTVTGVVSACGYHDQMLLAQPAGSTFNLKLQRAG